MTVYFIGAGPGDPDLLTIRGRRLIELCPICLYAGSLVPAEIVACAPKEAKVINTAELHLDEIIELMVQAQAAGQDVARVHSGDPSLYGAIAEQIRRLDELQIPYEVVPGVSSLTAAAAVTSGSCRRVVAARGVRPASEKARTRIVALPKSSCAARCTVSVAA